MRFEYIIEQIKQYTCVLKYIICILHQIFTGKFLLLLFIFSKFVTQNTHFNIALDLMSKKQ